MKPLTHWLRYGEKNSLTPTGHGTIFTVIKPGFLDLAPDIINLFAAEGWSVLKTKTTRLTKEQAEELYKVHKDKDFYESLVKYMSSGPCMAILYEAGRLGPTDFEDVADLKDTIRARWGKDEMRNVLHSSETYEDMEHEAAVFF